MILSDGLWIKARARAEAIGLTEELDGPRFEEYVRAVWLAEKNRGHVLSKGVARYMLKKSIGMRRPDVGPQASKASQAVFAIGKKR